MSNFCGVLNIHKEKDYTSHDVVAVVRKILNTKKVGHTGTLDPNAEGVLPICVGRATKIADFITSTSKKYVAVVHLGITTDTEDITGNIINKSNVNICEDELLSVIDSFKGKINQTPPMYSAIKIKGKKLYELARAGETIERKSREIEIFDIKIIDFLANNKFTIEVLCSKGTYIRTLCKDIGERLGCGACMGNLTRISTGNFNIENSIKLRELKILSENKDLANVFIGFEEIFQGLTKIIVKPEASNYLYNGNKISSNYLSIEKDALIVDEKVLIYDNNETLIGLYSVFMDANTKAVKPITMLNI